ncbi:MAG TPA: N-acetylglucosamine-6-phosphate deacetylase [Ilumatobacteraceae bacterium]
MRPRPARSIRDDVAVQVLARGRVVTPDGVVFGDVVEDGGSIVDVVGVDPAELTRSGEGEHWVCPGFIDLQINGASGIDITTAPHRIGDLARLLPAEGTTAFLPTVITSSHERRAAAIEAMASYEHTDGAVALGLHLEGPLLSPARTGAHDPIHLAHVASCPTASWTPENGVRLVTIAPELPGASELIAELVAAGVVVSVGHTDATAAEVRTGLDAGATYVTHLFNAMRPFSHRAPGPIGAVLADDLVVAGLIVDGLHVDPVAVQMAWRALGPDRITLVTDAVAARGAGDHADGVRLADGTLAGSAITLDAALRNLVAFTGACVDHAVRTVTATPARVLGLDDRGVIEPGARADVTVLDAELRVIATFVAGERAY